MVVLKRRLFINKNNGGISLTLPKKKIRLKGEKDLRYIKLKILEVD